jgi:hypothetical protein
MPWNATRNFGGGDGKIYTNPWGAKTSVAKGGAMPQGDFGTQPFTGYKPKSKAEADTFLDERAPQGQMLKQQIEEYRRRMLQQGQNE